MSTHFSGFELLHLLGDSATYPIESLAMRLGSSIGLRASRQPDISQRQTVSTGDDGQGAFAHPVSGGASGHCALP
ncbi:MAG: hypothetical protein K9K38_02665 [Rhodoferax sp.]|nr:hypothetical protein [Rhodoferax sp.]MCF8208294.1 hypothetical protein [Rhodoferax sp.]